MSDGPKILIVDDEPNIRDLLTTSLRFAGFEVATAKMENGQLKALTNRELYIPGSVLRAKVDPIVARAGCTVDYGGQFEAQQSASRTIYLMGIGVAIALVIAALTYFLSTVKGGKSDKAAPSGKDLKARDGDAA